MDGTKVLISPLSWGSGHAGRMIPLARELRKRGCEVFFAADAPLLEMAGRELPGVRMIEIPGLTIRYSRILPQYIAILLQLPHIIASAVRDHRRVRQLIRQIRPSVIVSDNRFGFYSKEVCSVYVTHQLRIPFPPLLRFMEPVAALMHRAIINKYDLCIVPDYPGSVNLSGRLSHPARHHDDNDPGGGTPGALDVTSRKAGRQGRKHVFTGAGSHIEEAPVPDEERTHGTGALPGIVAPPLSGPFLRHGIFPRNLVYAGPLSRFTLPGVSAAGSPIPFSRPYICLVLSGPEPQRSVLLKKVVAALDTPGSMKETITPDGGSNNERSPAPPASRLVVMSAGPVTPVTVTSLMVELLISPPPGVMRQVLTGASLVIARAGYTSVMELVSLGRGAVLVPAPGQTEQEYLGRYLDGRYGFITVSQKRLSGPASLASTLKRQQPSEQADRGTSRADHVNGPRNDPGEPQQGLPLPAGTPVTGLSGNGFDLYGLADPSPLLEKAVSLLLENK
jgi:hypothetical protein